MSQKDPKDDPIVNIRASTVVKIITPCVLVLLGATGYGTQMVRNEVSRTQPTEGFASKNDVQLLSREITRLNNAVMVLTTRIDRLNDHK